MSFFVRRAALSVRMVAKRPISPRVIPRPAARFNSTAPPPKSSNRGIIVTLALATAVAGGYWVYTSDSDAARTAKTAGKQGTQVGKAFTNFTPTKADYQKVYNKVASILETDNYDGSLPSYVIRSSLVVLCGKVARLLLTHVAVFNPITDGSYAPVLIRLAWHASGTYDKATGTGGRYATLNHFHKLIPRPISNVIAH